MELYDNFGIVKGLLYFDKPSVINIKVFGYRAFLDTPIIAPNAKNVSIYCNGASNACWEMETVDARNADILTVICDKSKTCEKIEFYCPRNSTLLNSCSISCNGNNACTKTYFYCVEGYNQIGKCNVTCDPTTCLNGRFRCGQAYQHESEWIGTNTINGLCGASYNSSDIGSST